MASGPDALGAPGDVPNHHLVIAANADDASVVEEVEVEHRAVVAGQRAQPLAIGQPPETDLAAVAAAGEHTAARRDRQRVETRWVLSEAHGIAAFGVARDDAAVAPRADQPPTRRVPG